MSTIANHPSLRRRGRAFRFAIATALTVTFGNGASADDTIVVLGDSNSAGFGVSQQDAFPARMESILRKRGRHVKVLNAGVTGDTFGGLASRVDSSVPKNAKLVIVQAGYNDLVFGVPPEQSIANMKTVLAKVRARGSRAVLCGFFNPKWDAIGRKVAASYGARFVPGSTCYDPRHKGLDGLHMSAAGHQVIAGRLTQVVGGGGGASKATARHARHKKNGKRHE